MVLCCWPCCCSYSRLALRSRWKWPGFLHQWKTCCTHGGGCARAYCFCRAVCSSSVFVVDAAICARSSLGSWQIGGGATWTCLVCTSISLSSCIQRSASAHACWKVTLSWSLTNRWMSWCRGGGTLSVLKDTFTDTLSTAVECGQKSIRRADRPRWSPNVSFNMARTSAAMVASPVGQLSSLLAQPASASSSHSTVAPCSIL